MAKKKAKKSKSSTGVASKMTSQVEAETTLRFGPEKSVLRQQADDALGERDSTVRAARGSAAGIKQAAKAAEPGIRKAYGNAGALLKGTAEMTDVDLAKLGPVADRYKASIARDRERATGRLGESLAGATKELRQREFDAEAGRAHAEGAARDRFAGTVSKLGGRLRDVATEEGAFQQARSGELAKDEAGRDFTASENAKDRGTRLATAGVDASGKVIKGGPKDKAAGPKKPPKNRLSPDQHAEARAKIGKVQGVVAGLVKAKPKPGKAGLSYEQLVNLAAQGSPGRAAAPGKVDEAAYDKARKANAKLPKAEQLPETELRRRATSAAGSARPATSGVGETVLARAVVDQARDGYVSRKTASMLHEAGYTVEGLGLTPYQKGGGPARSRIQRQRRRIKRPQSAVAAPGQPAGKGRPQ